MSRMSFFVVATCVRVSVACMQFVCMRVCSYIHFASCFYIDIYCIMCYYYTLCHNTYAYSLLFYKVFMKRENAGSWDSGLEKEQILETYSTQLQKF